MLAYTVGVKIKFPVRIFVALTYIRSTYVEWRNVITIVQRYAKSTVFTGYYTHQLVFMYPNLWLLDLEHEPKQLEASPPQQSGLQLESASLNLLVTTGVNRKLKFLHLSVLCL